MTSAHLIEFQDVSAGLAVPADDGFLFFSSEEWFDVLHGRTFVGLAALEREVARILRQAERGEAAGSSAKPIRAAA
jgi:hypothetical protein